MPKPVVPLERVPGLECPAAAGHGALKLALRVLLGKLRPRRPPPRPKSARAGEAAAEGGLHGACQLGPPVPDCSLPFVNLQRLQRYSKEGLS